MVTSIAKQVLPDQSASAAGVSGMTQQVSQAIHLAATQTGVAFSYLLNKAQQESGGDPNAQSSSSSATGLFQFTGQTWLKMVKCHGAQYGLSSYADHIKIDSDGTAHVSDPAMKKTILGLRKDPTVSAEMAGELDKENNKALTRSVGGKIGSTELYLAHFLGAGGAGDFLNTMREDPSAKAADILPDAAASNPTVFYNADGAAKSVKEIYQHFAKKFDQAPSSNSAVMLASATPVLSQTPQKSATAAYAANSYVVADGAAARSAYATTSAIQKETSSMLANMVMAQMKLGDMPAAVPLPATGTNNKKSLGSTLQTLV